jgi:hypothetical protein
VQYANDVDAPRLAQVEDQVLGVVCNFQPRMEVVACSPELRRSFRTASASRKPNN